MFVGEVKAAPPYYVSRLCGSYFSYTLRDKPENLEHYWKCIGALERFTTYIRKNVKETSEFQHTTQRTDRVPDKVRSRYLRSMVNLHKFLELADGADVYDNSGSGPQLVFMKKDREYQLSVDPGKYEWLNTYIFEHFKETKMLY